MPSGATGLFRYFLDGSMKTISAGNVVDPKRYYYPIFLAQVGVAATKLDSTTISVEQYREKNVLFLPDVFGGEDTATARDEVRRASRGVRIPFDVELQGYPIERNTRPIDSARKAILSMMHRMEIDLIQEFSESARVTRDALLMIDGSLQFYENLGSQREAFRNVVGVAKSFDVHHRLGSGSSARDVGTVVAGLKQHHRTPAHKIGHRNLLIGAWYLRLHSPTPIAGLGITDGVVKIEIFPDNPTGIRPELDTNRCDVISENVLNLRHPTTPWTDSRWASHLYPVYVTEQYIKTRFKSDRTMRAIL